MTQAYAVVIPAKNARLFIGAALESVAAQHVKPAEVVVVDDGSTDGTGEIARTFGVTVVTVSSSEGVSAARNRGILATTAPFIAFLDADDEWLPDHAQRLLLALNEADVLLASSGAEMFGAMNGRVDTQLPAGEPLDMKDALLRRNPIVQSTVIVARHAISAAGGYDEKLTLSEDYDLWNRIAEHGHFVYVDHTTVRRRIHHEQAMSKSAVPMARAAWNVRRSAVQRRIARSSANHPLQFLPALRDAARHDLASAIYRGQRRVLDAIRDEIAITDAVFRFGGQLHVVRGDDHTVHRFSENIRCLSRACYWSLSGLISAGSL